ncbi:MAG: imidazolonepropionase [bacterium]|nr:imidazolonepropionase [bacterium]
MPTREIDLLIHNAAELVTPRGDAPRVGAELGVVDVLEDAALACDAGSIVQVGKRAELERLYAPRATLDAEGGVLVPGFVDAHTHPVFLGTREDEFEMRAAGKSYVEISQAGGGIVSSVRGVRGASYDTLLAALLVRLDRFLELGTTTVEAKTGYGLALDDELKCLEVLAAAGAGHPIDIVPTFLGAHDFPPEYRENKSAYVDLVVEEMLPRVAESGLARYADIFTESHVFGLDDSRRIMTRASELGFGLRLHVDQLTPLGGAQLAAELGAASADHLEHVSDEGIASLAEAGVVPVLCPLVPLYLRETQEAPARRMVAGGLAPALATDFNPGSCYVQSLPEVLSWAALRYGFSAAEALTAATLNAACSVGLGERVGTLEAGKDADVVVLDVPGYRHLTYELGRNPVRAVVKAGALVVERRSALR